MHARILREVPSFTYLKRCERRRVESPLVAGHRRLDLIGSHFRWNDASLVLSEARVPGSGSLRSSEANIETERVRTLMGITVRAAGGIKQKNSDNGRLDTALGRGLLLTYRALRSSRVLYQESNSRVRVVVSEQTGGIIPTVGCNYHSLDRDLRIDPDAASASSAASVRSSSAHMDAIAARNSGVGLAFISSRAAFNRLRCIRAN